MTTEPFDWSSASPEERRAYAEAKTRAECEAQGIPFRLEDPVVADRIATLIRSATRRRERPFDFQRLEARAGLHLSALARALGRHRPQLYRWRAHGLTVDQADGLALRLGLHPVEIWGEDWWRVTLAPIDEEVSA